MGFVQCHTSNVDKTMDCLVRTQHLFADRYGYTVHGVKGHMNMTCNRKWDMTSSHSLANASAFGTSYRVMQNDSDTSLELANHLWTWPYLGHDKELLPGIVQHKMLLGYFWYLKWMIVWSYFYRSMCTRLRWEFTDCTSANSQKWFQSSEVSHINHEPNHVCRNHFAKPCTVYSDRYRKRHSLHTRV